jgi:AraC-like DNA-binding protein/mannose-6-phosphate isomerase-like protein (cupin superfamily)
MLTIKSKEVELKLNQKIKITSGEKCAFNIHYWGVTPNHKSNVVHKHSFFEVCYVLDGEGTYIENDVKYDLKPGTIFISLPGIYHNIINNLPLHIIYVAFDLVHEKTTDELIKLVNRIKCSNKIIHYSMDETSTILLWKSILYGADSNLCNIFVLRAQCHALLLNIIDFFDNKTNNKTLKIPTNSKDYSYFSRAKLFIQDNLMQPVKLDDLADYLYISSRHLTRIFKSEAGTSFNEYLQKQRIYLAAELLSNTDSQIKDIAFQTGFNTIQYFTTVFTKYIGKTPGNYRKDLINKNS